MWLRIVGIFLICFSPLASSWADEHRLEAIDHAAPSEGLAESVRATIGSHGFRVIRGANRALCEFWPCREWAIQPDFKPTAQVLYPFTPGQLIGVMHFNRRSGDFREQTIESGIYTVRYALQPVDGNHEGTSPTRDFLLLVRADDDSSPQPMEVKALLAASAKAAESNHPAMLCLQTANPADERPSLHHNDEHDWWVARFNGTIQGVAPPTHLPVDVVIVGHASE